MWGGQGNGRLSPLCHTVPCEPRTVDEGRAFYQMSTTARVTACSVNGVLVSQIVSTYVHAFVCL